MYICIHILNWLKQNSTQPLQNHFTKGCGDKEMNIYNFQFSFLLSTFFYQTNLFKWSENKKYQWMKLCMYTCINKIKHQAFKWMLLRELLIGGYLSLVGSAEEVLIFQHYALDWSGWLGSFFTTWSTKHNEKSSTDHHMKYVCRACNINRQFCVQSVRVIWKIKVRCWMVTEDMVMKGGRTRTEPRNED